MAKMRIPPMLELILNDEKDTLSFANLLAKALDIYFLNTLSVKKSNENNQKSLIVYLKGDLGAGKTTMVRGMINSLGYKGKVKSPSYSLVEEYHNLGSVEHLYHFDLYRLADPEELEFLGIRDYLTNSNSVSIIEWPEKGYGVLPEAELSIEIDILQDRRKVKVIANNDFTKSIVENLLKNISSSNQ